MILFCHSVPPAFCCSLYRRHGAAPIICFVSYRKLQKAKQHNSFHVYQFKTIVLSGKLKIVDFPLFSSMIPRTEIVYPVIKRTIRNSIKARFDLNDNSNGRNTLTLGTQQLNAIRKSMYKNGHKKDKLSFPILEFSTPSFS